MTTPAGWYDDPSAPGQLRWWDGATWTDHTHAGPTAAGQQADSVPFVAGQQQNWGAQPEGYVSGDGIVNDFGTWFGRAFTTPVSQFGPLLGIFAVQLVAWPLAWFLIHSGLSGAIVDDDGFQGVDVALLVAGAAVGLVGLFLALLGVLASSHSLYSSWVGRPATFGQSMNAGLRCLPRAVGYGLLLVLGYLAFAVALTLPFFAADAGLGGGATALLFVIAFFAVVVGAVYLWVKLGMFGIAAAVAPSGHSPISASWRSSNGFFWGVFGRMLLLSIVVAVIQQVVGLIVQTVAFGALMSSFEITSGERIMVDGAELGADGFIELDQVLPDPMLAGLLIVVLGLVNLAISAVSTAGWAGLYADLGGPNTFGHRRRGRSF